MGDGGAWIPAFAGMTYEARAQCTVPLHLEILPLHYVQGQYDTGNGRPAGRPYTAITHVDKKVLLC